VISLILLLASVEIIVPPLSPSWFPLSASLLFSHQFVALHLFLVLYFSPPLVEPLNSSLQGHCFLALFHPPDLPVFDILFYFYQLLLDTDWYHLTLLCCFPLDFTNFTHLSFLLHTPSPYMSVHSAITSVGLHIAVVPPSLYTPPL
jgi:hypothetical protein